MPTLAQILLITLITAIISTTLTYFVKVRKVTRKDFKKEDYAKNRRPDITVGL